MDLTQINLSPVFFRLELLSTAMIAGLIWTIQIVHYPLLLKVSKENFIEYESSHCFRVSFIVAPLMVTELISCGALAFLSGFNPLVCGRLGLVIIAWVSTAFIQVPLHNKLKQGYDAAAIHSLVSTNWIRTAVWSLRALMLVFEIGVP